MNDDRVAKMLQKIHQSDPLLSMLKRLGKSPLRPESILTQIITELTTELVQITQLNKGFFF